VAQLNLHPCAVRLTWLSDRPTAGGDWELALRQFIENLGENCISGGASLIGHIKGIATVAGRPCLQLSLVSTNQAVIIDGSVADGTNELRVTLNVLVFGLSAEKISAVLRDTHVQASSSWPGSIEIEILPAAEEYALANHGEGEAEKL
jgi:hypothetical protein